MAAATVTVTLRVILRVVVGLLSRLELRNNWGVYGNRDGNGSAKGKTLVDVEAYCQRKDKENDQI